MNPLNFAKYLPHFLRKRIKEKIIIIESDDWGMERLICGETLDWMRRKFGEESFTRWSYDSLETPEDLDLIFDLLERYESKFEKPPVITANFITHNVDYDSKESLKFKSINSGFNAGSDDVRNLYLKGIDKGYIYPQLHGYSHYNVSELKNFFETEEGREAHERKFFTAKSTMRKNLSSLQGEFSLNNKEASGFESAAAEFKKFFGFYSSTMIPPAFIFNEQYTSLLSGNGIRMVQSSNRLMSDKKAKFRHPFFRQKDNLYWSVRNCRLDPVPEYGFYSGQCIESIRKAFEFSYPAVIDFHRVNFSGKFKPEVRERTLTELKLLFDAVYEKWPSVKFMNSSEFAERLWQH